MRSVVALLFVTLCACSSKPTPKRIPNSRTVDLGNADVSSREDASAAICTDFGEPALVGEVQDTRLQEISGIRVSPTQNAIWAHNDSGEPTARFYGIDLDTLETAGIFELEGAVNIDWEDMAGAVIDGTSYLYFGDVGDNNIRDGLQGRDEIVVYRVEEPDLDGQNPDAIQNISDYDTYRLQYPDEKFDCEAVMVDPQTADIYLIGKPAEGPSSLFVASRPADGSTTTLELAATVQFGSPQTPGTAQTTAASIAPDRSAILVRTFTTVLHFGWGADQTFNEAVSKTPTSLPPPMEAQGEAIDFAPDGRSYYSVGEGFTPGLHFSSCQD